MKRIASLLFAAAALFSAVSCEDDPLKEQVTGDKRAQVYTASFESAGTKAMLCEQVKTVWEKNDSILIYDGTSAAKYFADVKETSLTADFSIGGKEIALLGEKVFAVYPVSADPGKSAIVDVEGKTIRGLSLTDNQNARAGSFDPNAALALAYSEDTNLNFRNLTSLVKFSVKNEGVKVVVVRTKNQEIISGGCSVELVDGEPVVTPADNGGNWVALVAGEGAFEVGKDYYISVLPRTLEGGFTVEFTFDGVTGTNVINEYSNFKEFRRNVIYNLGELQYVPPTDDSEATLGVVGEFNNWGNADDAGVVTADRVMEKVTETLYVARSIELPEGEFKIRWNNTWDDAVSIFGIPELKVLDADYVYDVITGYDGKNMKVAAGTYDIWIDIESLKLYVMSPGNDIANAKDPSESTDPVGDTWGIIGTVNNWGIADEDGVAAADILMEEISEGLFVARSVALPDGEFKIRRNSEWNDDANIGLPVPGDVAADYVYEVISSGGSQNISIAAGTYDIWFDLAAMKLYVMTPGNDISNAQTPSGPEQQEITLYLKPNANWNVDGARFAAYFFHGNNSMWVDMTAVEGKDGYYECTVTTSYPNVIFCRMNPSTTENNWNNKWNQTADLVIPTDGTNLYTVPEGTWDNGNGTWGNL